MGIEVIKGAGMAYQGSSSTAEMKEENVPKIENAENLTVSENLAKDTSDLNTCLLYTSTGCVNWRCCSCKRYILRQDVSAGNRTNVFLFCPL